MYNIFDLVSDMIFKLLEKLGFVEKPVILRRIENLRLYFPQN